MPIEPQLSRLAALVFAVALLVLVLAGSPLTLPDPADKAAHFAAFSLLTLFLWRATAGQMAPALLVGLVVFALFDEWRQAYVPGRSSDATDFLADFCAVLATGTLLFMQRKSVCAESSPP